MSVRLRVSVLFVLTLSLLACSKRQPGAACSLEPDEVVCAQDGKALLACEGRRFVVAAECASCGGSSPRKRSELDAVCSLAREGACGEAFVGQAQCADGTTVVACLRKAGAASPALRALPCRGPRGCQRGAEVRCDQSVAAVGDPCDATRTVQKRTTACVAKGDAGPAVAECDLGTWRLRRRCTGPDGCKVDDLGVHCDNPIVFEDDSIRPTDPAP